MKYLGDYAEDATIDFKFSTHQADGTPITLAGTPAVAVYKANGTNESTAGVTLTVDFDSRTGCHHVRIDTAADAFYATANDYQVVITAGTVDGVSVVGTVVGVFSIENRNIKANMVAYLGETALSSGEDGVPPAVLLDGSLTAGKFASGAIDANALASDAIAEIQSGLALATDLATLTGYVDTEVAAIKAKTDNLPSDPADQSLLEAAITAATAGLATASSLSTVASNVASILADTGTDGVVVAAGSKTGYALTSGERDSIAAAILDLAAGIQTDWTLRQALRVILAVAAGKINGADTSTVNIRDVGDSKNRVVATVDATGRTAVTYDKS